MRTTADYFRAMGINPDLPREPSFKKLVEVKGIIERALDLDPKEPRLLRMAKRELSIEISDRGWEDS